LEPHQILIERVAMRGDIVFPPITRTKFEIQCRVPVWLRGDQDLGQLVMLPGGEVGQLTAWWSPEDHQEWRWSVELYNHR